MSGGAALRASGRVLGELFDEVRVSPEYCAEALRREITQVGMPKKNECIAGLRKWTLLYDSFLGYMAGVLPLIDGGEEGFIV